MNAPVDQSARDVAADPTRSVIVQAPAGSGKTGLLVRRFITLLAHVEAPEQILAITFTRKATAEMRQRVLCVLQGVKENGESEDNAELVALGDAARRQDAEQGWNLLDNSRRLRIQTIDSFCGELVRRMPWSARFGATPQLLEDASALHEEAASLTLDMVEDGNQLADHCAVLIDLLDSNRAAAASLLAGMLGNRDQWMRSLENFDRTQIEGWWRSTINESLGDLDRSIALPDRAQLASLARFASAELGRYREGKPNHPVSAVEAWSDGDAFPEPVWEQVALWRGTAAMLLTNTGGLRKQVDVRTGFPKDADEKRALLELLSEIDDEGPVHRAWDLVRALPDGELGDDQWRIINALLRLLPVAAAQLRVLFSERNLADYTELAQRADMALGRVDEPSDLALAMDYRLQHILVDEFQDTSSGQIQLLEKLLAGWTPGDGRSAFFVGDPMQSIYRFREAEVGIFMDTQDHGIADLRPEIATLACNFRSDPALVNWFNERFVEVMPKERDILNGAVNYTPAVAYRAHEPGADAIVHAGLDRSPETEALRVADIVAATLEGFPGQSIAILGRTRGQLAAIIAELDQREISWQGIRLQKLGQRQAIQDLLSLTLALGDPADRVAWLGVLRGPWLGATLSELTRLCGANPETAVPSCLDDPDFLAQLDPARRDRFVRVAAILGEGLGRRGEGNLANNLEACWLSLGGPAGLDVGDIGNARRFIELVDKADQGTEPVSRTLLEDAMQELYAESGREAPVQLMTIHASKGIEFDTVILPGLHQPGRGDGATLLRWRVLPDRILVAPRPTSSEDGNRFFDYLGALEKEHQRNEASRLIYVACTRARSRLHVFGSVGVDEKKGEIKPPPATSLLSVLWNAVKQEFDDVLDAPQDEPVEPGSLTAQPAESALTSLPNDWLAPLPGPSVDYKNQLESSTLFERVEYDWAQTLTRVIGIVVHQVFEDLSEQNWDSWCSTALGDEDRRLWRNRLARRGLCGAELEQATSQVEAILNDARNDPNAQWIFSPDNTDVRTEWPLSGVINGGVRHIVLDRVFTDPQGERWIIDFKSGSHDSQRDLGQFLDQERQRYQSTMAAYSKILGALEQTRINTALYYPSLQQLVEL